MTLVSRYCTLPAMSESDKRSKDEDSPREVTLKLCSTILRIPALPCPQANILMLVILIVLSSEEQFVVYRHGSL